MDGTAFASLLALIFLFFLLQSSLVFKPGISIELPSPTAMELPGITGPTIVVGVDHNGQYYFDGKIISNKDLLQQLIQVHKKLPETVVIIAADRATQLETLATLNTLTYQAGLQTTLLATKPSIPSPQKTNSSHALPQ